MVFLDRDSTAVRVFENARLSVRLRVCFNLGLKRAEKTIEMVQKPNNAEPQPEGWGE
jgi:hypothetical protein